MVTLHPSTGGYWPLSSQALSLALGSMKGHFTLTHKQLPSTCYLQTTVLGVMSLSSHRSSILGHGKFQAMAQIPGKCPFASGEV